MIISLIIKLFVSVVQGLLSLLPHFDPPSWVSDVGTAAGTVAGALSGSSAWLPWNALFVAVGVVMACYVAAGGIRIFRIVASFVTLGGGS